MQAQIIAQLKTTRINFYAWRNGLSFTGGVFLSLFFAALTGVAAQVALPLPGTPVPVTGQTLAVLLSGVLLGRRLGPLSQFFYIGLGAAGVPWLAGAASGLSALSGATGGYLVGFVLAAWFLGFMSDRGRMTGNGLTLLTVLGTAAFVIIHGAGLCGLALWLGLGKGRVPALPEILSLGFFPFIAGDVIKVLLAAGAARVALPRQG